MVLKPLVSFQQVFVEFELLLALQVGKQLKLEGELLVVELLLLQLVAVERDLFLVKMKLYLQLWDSQV